MEAGELELIATATSYREVRRKFGPVRFRFRPVPRIPRGDHMARWVL